MSTQNLREIISLGALGQKKMTSQKSMEPSVDPNLDESDSSKLNRRGK